MAMGDAPAEPDRDGDGIVDQMDAGEEDDSKAARKEQAQEVQQHKFVEVIQQLCQPLIV
jgi:hypothetical protein